MKNSSLKDPKLLQRMRGVKEFLAIRGLEATGNGDETISVAQCEEVMRHLRNGTKPTTCSTNCTLIGQHFGDCTLIGHHFGAIKKYISECYIAVTECSEMVDSFWKIFVKKEDGSFNEVTKPGGMHEDGTPFSRQGKTFFETLVVEINRCLQAEGELTAQGGEERRR